MVDALGFAPDAAIRCRDFKIGCIGAGFIMADVHLAAYIEAGFPVVAIASRNAAKAAEVARRWGIGRVHETPERLIEDGEVEIVDIAFPPDQQPDLIRHVLKQPHVKAILAQKPLALDLTEAKTVEEECRAAGKVLSVNQNMRFDQSMRVLKQLLDRGDLGEPVIATIEMRAIPHWQDFLRDLDLHFKDIDFSTPESITVEKAKRVRETFRDHDLPVCCVSGYTNIVHPDPAERKRRLDQLKAIIRHARHFGSPYVISETGTCNTESDWVHHPKNKTEEGFADCREVIRELAQLAYDHGAVFLLETYVNNVVGSIEETVRMFAEVDHPGLGLLMDPTNYFEDHNIDRMDAVLKQIFDTLSDRVRISHAKDVKRAEADTSEKHADIGDEDALESRTFRGVGAIELPAPGLGSLNYDLYLKRLAEKHPNIPIIIEHLEEADVPRAKKFLDGRLRAHGL